MSGDKYEPSPPQSEYDGAEPEPSVLEVQQESEPMDMDGGYGWVVVFTCFLMLISSWGLNSAYGIYFTYYVDTDRFPGAKPLDYAAIGGLSIGSGMLFAPVINFIQGIIGTRPTIIVGCILQFAAGMLASFSVELWQLYLTQGVLQSFGLAFISLPAMTLVPQWFVKRRSLANLFVVMGSGVGGVIFNLGLQKIIDVKSVEWALRAQSIIAAGLIGTSVIFIRTKSSHHKVEFTIFDLECVKCTGFWIFNFYLVTTMLGYVVVMYSLADFTVSLGYSANQGSIVATMLQVGFCLGRPFAGFLSDQFGPITIAAGAYALTTIFTLGMWIPCKNYATLIALGLLEGITMGAVFPTMAPIVARLVGISKLGIAFSMLNMLFGASSLVSNIIGNVLTSGTGRGQYRNTAVFAGCAFFASTVAMLILRGYIITRDMILESGDEKTERSNDLHIVVPRAEVLKNCLKWRKKLA